MNSLLVHGCYDLRTLETLKNLNTKEFAFDLRGRSSNLVTFKDLANLLTHLKDDKVFLTFGDDKKETVLSFLNLLQLDPHEFMLIFRDHQTADYYKNLNLPFFWMFHPEGDWKTILGLSNAKGVLLPLKYQLQFQKLQQFWDLIDQNNLEVYLHAETFEETLFLKLENEVKLSLDLSKEVEQSYRTVDQDRLMNMKLWRRLHENSAGQR